MSTRRVMRPMSLGNIVLRQSLAAAGPRRQDAPARAFCVLRTVQDIHDGLRAVLGLGVEAARRQLSPTAAAGWPVEPKSRTGLMRRDMSHASLTHSRSISNPSQHSSQPASDTTSPSPGAPTASLPEQLRSVMRLLPHSVVVCTAMHGAVPRAMTMSSFTSLTLSPTPLVTFNIAVPSRTLDAIAASREFNVHVMAGDEGGAALAHRFTRGNSADEDVFDGVEWSRPAAPGAESASGTMSPPLLGGEGVLQVLRCRVLADAPHGGLMRVRDHVIVVGEVLGTVAGGGCKVGLGLTYADRRYRRTGGELDVGKARET